MTYASLAHFYDEIVGPRSDEIALIQQLIKKHHPKAKTILEVACGTGSLLKPLSKKYDVAGLDLSPDMLSIARDKLPKTPLYENNMTSFSLGQTFDIIICAYDSINHLTKISDWKKFFVRAKEHLNPDGVLIFDINTPYKLEKLSQLPPFVCDFDQNVYVLDVVQIKKDIYDWYIRFFHHQGGGSFQLLEQLIEERSFSNEKIKSMFPKDFQVLQILDPDRKRPSSKSERLYFVARRR